MTNTAKALYNFFSGFGLPAYVEYSPPEDAQLPYITYQAIEPSWDETLPSYARVFYRSTSYVALHTKVDQILALIGKGKSHSIHTPSGCVILSDGKSQDMPMEGDDTLKVAYITFNIQAPTM